MDYENGDYRKMGNQWKKENKQTLIKHCLLDIAYDLMEKSTRIHAHSSKIKDFPRVCFIKPVSANIYNDTPPGRYRT